MAKNMASHVSRNTLYHPLSRVARNSYMEQKCDRPWYASISYCCFSKVIKPIQLLSIGFFVNSLEPYGHALLSDVFLGKM